MRSPKVFIYLLSVVILTATSCKSCKNKFSKEEAPVAKEVSAYEDSAYAGLSSDTATTSNTSVDASSTSTTDEASKSTDAVASSNSNSSKQETNSNTSSDKKMAADVEKENIENDHIGCCSTG